MADRRLPVLTQCILKGALPSLHRYRKNNSLAGQSGVEQTDDEPIQSAWRLVPSPFPLLTKQPTNQPNIHTRLESLPRANTVGALVLRNGEIPIPTCIFLLVSCMFPSEQILNKQFQYFYKKNKVWDLLCTHIMFLYFTNPSPGHAKAYNLWKCTQNRCWFVDLTCLSEQMGTWRLCSAVLWG